MKMEVEVVTEKPAGLSPSVLNDFGSLAALPVHVPGPF